MKCGKYNFGPFLIKHIPSCKLIYAYTEAYKNLLTILANKFGFHK